MNKSFRERPAARRETRVRFATTLAAGLVAGALAGCGSADGPQRAAVSGSVSVNGQPLASGVIRFVPTGQTKGPAAVAPVTNGTYELPEAEGPVVGTHRVEIEASGHVGFELDDESAYAQMFQQGRALPKNPVPEEFNRHSKLSANVDAAGPNRHDFAISTPR